MCLVLLEQVVQPGISVLDVGTGSGILAIAAIKLGAARCLALDIEPQAVQVARANAIRNSVADRIEVREGTLGLPRSRHPLLPRGGRGNKGTATSSLPLWEGGVGGSGADLVVANITAAAVAGMASAFARALRLGGRLIGSGIIGERLGEVVDALHAAGFTIDEVREEGDWRALLATSTRDEPTPH
jgi:ribosomal protein L11 methyltransferase